MSEDSSNKKSAPTRETTEQGESDQPGRSQSFFRNNLPYILLAIAAILLVPFFVPFGGVESETPDVGDISTKEIIAPFDFPILKTEEELERERTSARQNVPFVLDFVEGMASSAVSEFESLWNEAMATLDDKDLAAPERLEYLKSRFPNISVEAARTLSELRHPGDVKTTTVELLNDVYANGVFNWKSLDKGDTALLFNIRKGKKEHIVPSERISTIESAGKKIEERAIKQFERYHDKGKLVFELAKSFLRPNLIPDKNLTERNRNKAVESVKLERGGVLKEQRIVDAHERVTEEIHQKLVSLAKAKSGRYSNRPVVYSALTVIARFVLTLLVLWLFAQFIQLRFPTIWSNPRKIILLLFAIWIPCLFAFVFRSVGWPEYITPIAFSATLIAILLGTETSIAVVLSSSVIVALSGAVSQSLLITLLIEGIVCGLMFGQAVTRRDSIRIISFTVGAVLVTVFVLDFVSLTEYGTLGIRALSVTAASIFGPLLAIGLLPMFEKFAALVTDFTLVDYANTNSQILQQLAIEAPGTFHHSIVVSNMAETAAEAVGADPLLVKAGALYHDIGKLSHPYYFSENLNDENPHDKLSPKMSFLVLSAHVGEGVRLAERSSLPKPIVDIIRQHHGDSVMAYFYERAKERDDSVREEDFRYPGPKPQTKEAAIVMLADTIEATVRSIGDIEKRSLTRLIRKTIEEKFISGQLSECEITTRHLELISDAFTKILEGVLHRRPKLIRSDGSIMGIQLSDEE